VPDQHVVEVLGLVRRRSAVERSKPIDDRSGFLSGAELRVVEGQDAVEPYAQPTIAGGIG
jgi:hypothetical protein